MSTPLSSSLIHPAASVRQVQHHHSPWPPLARAVWDFLAAAGARRAERELHHLAQHWDVSSPEMARQLRCRLTDAG